MKCKCLSIKVGSDDDLNIFNDFTHLVKIIVVSEAGKPSQVNFLYSEVGAPPRILNKEEFSKLTENIVFKQMEESKNDRMV